MKNGKGDGNYYLGLWVQGGNAGMEKKMKITI